MRGDGTDRRQDCGRNRGAVDHTKQSEVLWEASHNCHAFASTLFRQGIKINVVSKLLGHKDVATTYKIYIHMIPEEMDEAVDAVGKVMMGTR